MSSDKTRFSDVELEEFRQIINDKISKAENDLELIKSAYTNDSNNGTDDTSPLLRVLKKVRNIIRKKTQLALIKKSLYIICIMHQRNRQ